MVWSKIENVSPNASQILNGQYILVDQPITSTNGKYSAFLRADGSLAVRRNQTNTVIWSRSLVQGKAVSKLVVLPDCKLAVYGPDDSILWSTGYTYDTYKYNTALIIGEAGRLYAWRSEPSRGGDWTIFDNYLKVSFNLQPTFEEKTE